MSGAALTATYRLQLHAGFGFANVRERVDYFARLGVSHLYLSPILTARRGSRHGYDVVDPTHINPELGTEDELRALAAELNARSMGLLVDLVPNHMGIGAENRFWDDVLAHGERSRYARWFDIDWAAPGASRKVVLPVLGDELEGVLQRGELWVRLVPGGSPRLAYFDHSFPLDPATLPADLQLAQADAEAAAELVQEYSTRGSRGDSAARERLAALLENQHYRLTFWRRGASEINYRRFFDVNDLAALRVEDQSVFDETHALILSLVRDGVIDGLRIDHVDGLLDPLGYLQRLRGCVGEKRPIVVEKILTEGETLPREWPVQGTTGYEFLNTVEDLFLDPAGYAMVATCYRRLRRLSSLSFADLARSAKRAILSGALFPDVSRVARLLAIASPAIANRWPEADAATVIVELVACLPVYRTYIDCRSPVSPADRGYIETAAQRAAAVSDRALLDEIVAVILGERPEVERSARLAFVQRLQQLSGPAMAKGVEDTALYLYMPLASRNEVGGAPDRPVRGAVERFHAMNRERATSWPAGLSATNTHDTKRSADVRTRLDALTEHARDWERVVRRWRRLNGKHRAVVRGRLAPDTNSEYLFYQTILALWPAPRPGRRSDDLPDRAWRDAARARLVRYMIKAAREAKNRTSWTDPDTAFECALERFVASVLEPSEEAPFLADVARLVARIAPAGASSSLSRVVLHLTAPGTPDIYQGDELWNVTLVDPDNRAPVDFDARAKSLSTLAAIDERLRDQGASDLFDAGLKLLVTERLLRLRRDHAELFRRGRYEPLNIRGPRADHVVAFVRHLDQRTCMTLASRLLGGDGVRGIGGIVGGVATVPGPEWWRDTVVEIPPAYAAPTWRSQIVSGHIDGTEGPGGGSAGKTVLKLSEAFAKLPVAVLLN